MLIRSNAGVWEQYIQHDFVKQLGQGTLSRERFIHFLKCATTVLLSLPLLTKHPSLRPPFSTGKIISISNIMLEHMGMAVSFDGLSPIPEVH